MTDWIARAEALDLQIRNLVNGKRAESPGALLEKQGPRDGRLLYRFGAGNSAVAHAAVQCARKAFEDSRWSGLPIQKRKDALYRLADLVDAHREELALLESLDVGKPIQAALEFDVPYSAARLRSAAEGVDHVYGRVFGADRAGLAYQLRRPVGVVAGIIGWNFPLVLATEKIAPVLAMGNTLVLKPSELTALSAARLAELALEAGVPEGVLNVIHGDAALGAALAEHRAVDLLTFTGSSRTGKALMIAAGQSNMKRLVLECGGKAPNIVFDDAPDLNAVAEAVVARAYWNQGEVCTASSRLLVHEPIRETLVKLVVQKAARLRPGDPLKPDTTFGALVSRDHQQKVTRYIASGRNEGARLVHEADAAVPFADGFYLPPVIFDRVSPEQTIAREEIFGPVLCVMGFTNEADAIHIANDTLYGLSAIIWTKDLGRAHRLTQAIRAGWIVVNATNEPLDTTSTGVLAIGGHKESGICVEGGIEGLEAYTTSTAVQVMA